MSGAWAAGGRAFRLEVTVGRGYVDLVASGDLDVAAADTLHRVMRRAERLDMGLICHLRDVDFIDSRGLEPFVDAARRRGPHPATALRVADASRPVRRLLDLTGLGGDSTLDPQAWHAFSTQPLTPAPSLDTRYPRPVAVPGAAAHE